MLLSGSFFICILLPHLLPSVISKFTADRAVNGMMLNSFQMQLHVPEVEQTDQSSFQLEFPSLKVVNTFMFNGI